jgi:superfamily I DNA/RNA helicase
MRRVLVLGGPGAGKTTRLLAIVKAALRRGIAPNRIALVTFTKAAVAEAVGRASKEFGRSPDDFSNFKTVHAAAFRELGLKRADVLSDEHLDQVSEITGELLSTLENPFSDAPAAGKQADPLLTLDHYARTTGKDLDAAWRDHGAEVEWHRLLRFSRAYEAYKDDEGVLDFTDMLLRYDQGPFGPLDVDVAIVDEGQDLSRAQWRCVFKMFSGAEELWVAGDDMQMIHHWAGADEERFLSLASDGFAVENLPLSHRLARAPFRIAAEIGARIERRYAREWNPSDREGSVDWVSGPEDVDLSGEWLLLARTRAQLPALASAAREQGIAYSVKGEKSVRWEHVRAIKAWESLRAGKSIEAGEIDPLEKALGRKLSCEGREHLSAKDLDVDATNIWHDALTAIDVETREYYLAILRRGGKLTDEPPVRVDTIHGSKGTESKNVMLSTDMTWRTNRAMEISPDAEHRVFYVGATRCIDNLTLIAPRTAYGYAI